MDASVVLTTRERELLVALAKLRAPCSSDEFLHHAWPNVKKTSASRALRTAICRLIENFGEEFVDVLGIQEEHAVFKPLERHAVALVIGSLVECGHIDDARECLEAQQLLGSRIDRPAVGI